MAYNIGGQHIKLYRLDAIRSIKQLAYEPEFEKYMGYVTAYLKHLWGASAGTGRSVEHIEMLVRAEEGEHHIPVRLAREKRCGHVDMIDEHSYRFSADVYDAMELLPWLRTFIGRILSLSCSNTSVTETFYADLAVMRGMYEKPLDSV
jgi:hypothetical protein